MGQCLCQHGLPYYPKLLSAVPFTPVRGPRLLVAADVDEKALTHILIKAAVDYARSEKCLPGMCSSRPTTPRRPCARPG